MKPEALLKAGFTFLTCLLLQQAAKAQLKMGGDSPASLRGDALLELNSNKQGLLLPRISLAALSQHPLDTAANGLVVFVKEQNSLFIRKNATWQKMFDADNLTGTVSSVNGSSGALTLTASTGIKITGLSFENDGALSFNTRKGDITPTEGDYTLNLLGDVTTTTPAADQLLRYDGTNWANWTPDYAKLAASLTAGSVLFANASGAIAQNNANFFWDNTNSRLGIGTNTLAQKLTVAGDALLNGNYKQYFVATTDYYVGVGRNNNFSLVSNRNAAPLRIGAKAAQIGFFTDGNADVTDVPQMLIDAAGNVGIGETAPTSKLDVGGSFAVPVVTSAGNITLNNTHYLVIMTAAGAVTLPAASTCPGRVYQVKRTVTGTNTITVRTAGTDRFDRTTGPTVITLATTTTTGTGHINPGANANIYKTYSFVSGGAINVWYVTSF